MSPAESRRAMARACFPRMSGDEPREYEKDFTASSFSPHERG